MKQTSKFLLFLCCLPGILFGIHLAEQGGTAAAQQRLRSTRAQTGTVREQAESIIPGLSAPIPEARELERHSPERPQRLPGDFRAAFDMRMRVAITRLDRILVRMKTILEAQDLETESIPVFLSLSQSARNRSVRALRRKQYAVSFQAFRDARANLVQAAQRLQRQADQESTLMQYLNLQHQSTAEKSPAGRRE